jgi:uncharacterized protein YegL
MMHKDLIAEEDLATNPGRKIPCCLVLDNSASMSTIVDEAGEGTGEVVVKEGKTYELCNNGITRMDKLNDAIKQFFKEVRSDKQLEDALDISMVMFDDDCEIKRTNFYPVYTFDDFEDISVNDRSGSPLGKAVDRALDLLIEQKQKYKDYGKSYNQPWLVIMTDGEPWGDDEEKMQSAVDRIATLAPINGLLKLNVICVSMDSNGDDNALGRLSPVNPVLDCDNVSFGEFFRWFAATLTEVAKSLIGDDCRPDFTKIVLPKNR